MLPPARAIAYAIHSLQINNAEEVVFRLNITCKTIFILSLQTFKTSLSLSIKIFLKEEKKNSRVEVDAYCFEVLAWIRERLLSMVLARVMIIKFKPEIIHV